MKKIIIFILFANFIFQSFGQVSLFIPNKGIEGIPIILDTSTILDVIKIYGNDYIENESNTEYKYEKLGLTFQIDAYDKNQIVRSIFVEHPFQGKTSNGIILNESTMNDVWNLYDTKGCFISTNYAWNFQNGISFYIKKEFDQKYNPDEKIYKIEIHNKNRAKISSIRDFYLKFMKEKTSELISILKSDTIDFEELDLFFEKEEATKEIHRVKKRTIFNRKIERELLQEYSKIDIAHLPYYLNIIKSKENVIFLKFVDGLDDSVLFVRENRNEIEKLALSNTDFEVYTYGTFCSVGGEPPKKCREMLQLVRENNYDELTNWLNSVNPELAAYGYMGMYFLKKRRNEILPTESERMKELEKSNIQLNTCQGCAFEFFETMSNELKQSKLKQNYLRFQQFYWLRE